MGRFSLAKAFHPLWCGLWGDADFLQVAAMRANPANSGFFSAIERGDITSAIQAAQENPELMQTIQGLLQG